MARRSRSDQTEVSCVIKYLVFGFNVLFWLLGGAIAGIGIWAWTEKDMFQNISKLTSISIDPALIFIIVGGIMFLIGFTGCVGALRENTCLLLCYCVAVGLIFFGQLVVGILAFVYKDWFCVSIGVIFFCQVGFGVFLFVQKDWVKDQITNSLKHIIIDYREDPDLQNLIDWVQQDWLKCCGVENYKDWDVNMYFNCSSPSRERCGVPFSCCKPKPQEVIKNKQCGYDTRDPTKTQNPETKIYTIGCLKAGEKWLEKNLIPVAAVAVAVALIQILGICFAQNLRSDIYAQKSKWH